MNKPNVGQFFREVRQESAKVTWPSRRETAVSTGLVFMMVILAALFFLSVDWILSHFMKLLLGIGV